MSPSGAVWKHMVSMCRDACSMREIPLPPRGQEDAASASSMGCERFLGPYGYLPPYISGVTSPKFPSCQDKGSVGVGLCWFTPTALPGLLIWCVSVSVLASSRQMRTAAAAVTCSKYSLTSINFIGKIRTEDLKLLQDKKAQGVISLKKSR